MLMIIYMKGQNKIIHIQTNNQLNIKKKINLMHSIFLEEKINTFKQQILNFMELVMIKISIKRFK